MVYYCCMIVSISVHKQNIRLLYISWYCSAKVSNFECLNCNISYITSNGVVKKLHNFNYMCATIRRTLQSTRKETRPTFYKVMTLPTLFYVSENWT